jgi:hypothetical protein
MEEVRKALDKGFAKQLDELVGNLFRGSYDYDQPKFAQFVDHVLHHEIDRRS